MSRLLALPLSLLCLLLALAAPIQATPPPTGAQRLTSGAALLDLVAWPEDGHVARDAAPLLTPLTVRVTGTRHELWWGEARLFATEEEILGRPALAPDGRWLVVARIPRGAETASLGELWRYELATGRWTPLTHNGAEETSPVISPDGQQVAFLRDGDLWLIPADRTTVEPGEAAPAEPKPLALTTHVPPTSIRVMHGAANTCRSVPVGQIDTIPFEAYIKRVVPHESPASWHAEALKAQAVAARTYAWYQMQGREGEPYDVTDTTAHQYMCDTTDPRTDAAVDATVGQHLTYQGRIIPTLFSAENSSATRQNLYGHSYLSAVDDPPAFGARRRGHGQGYSQWGGKRWAEAGWRYGQILLHYYTGASLEPPAGDGQSLLEVANRPLVPYLRGSALLVRLNGSNLQGTRAREWLPDGAGGLAHRPWQEDRNATDGWQHLFDLRALPDLPHAQYRVEYGALLTARQMQTETLPVLYLGIDRTSPTFTATLALPPGEPITQPLALHLTMQATDSLSGLERVGWGVAGGEWEVAALDPALAIEEASALGGQALRLQPGSQGAQSLTFAPFPASPDHYRLWFRLRTDALASAQPVATLRLLDDSPSRLQRGVRYLRAADFASTGWEWFYVDIDLTTAYSSCPADPSNPAGECGALQAVIEWHGAQRLDVDQLLLSTRPTMPLTETTVSWQVPDPLWLYGADRAGNVALLHCTASLRPTPPPPPIPAEQAQRLYLPIMRGGTGGQSDQYEYRCAP